MPSSDTYDIVIVGASFAGLTLAHHLPRELSILVIDSKPTLDHAVESTGLITQATYDALAGFCDVASFIPNRITHIGVVAPDYTKHFFSHTREPWIYSTDTPKLVQHLAETVPPNVRVQIGTKFLRSEPGSTSPVRVVFKDATGEHTTECRFLVGADGAYSSVARDRKLETNTRFLMGFEKVFLGDILLGPAPDATVYHFWFGEFSLGYGGWLSPTTVDGKKAFRLGLAKLKQDAREWVLIRDFIRALEERGFIRIEPGTTEVTQFSSLIPMSGPLRRVHDHSCLLIGDSAGMCGAFAADGIKGAVISGQVAAELIPRSLAGEKNALPSFHRMIEDRSRLMTYYRKQIIYRMAWDIMQRDDTFTTLFSIIERQRDHFLEQFCDSKDRQKSLLRVLFRWSNIDLLTLYTLLMVRDMPIAFFRSALRHGWRFTIRETIRWVMLPLRTLRPY